MNDDFLMRYQPAVRPEFAAALAHKLHRQARRQAWTRGITVTLVVIAMGLSTLVFLPQTRAAVLDFIREIGGMGFIECTWDECLEISASLESPESTREANYTSRMFNLDQARAEYPIIDNFLPTWLPERFQSYDNQIHVSWGEDGVNAAIMWSTVTMSDTIRSGKPFTAPWCSLGIWTEEVSLYAKTGTLEEVTVDGHPAAIYNNLVGDRSYDNEPIYALSWRQNDLHYSLAWTADRIPREQILRMAASIPDRKRLPVPAEQLDDLLRQMLSDQE